MGTHNQQQLYMFTLAGDDQPIFPLPECISCGEAEERKAEANHLGSKTRTKIVEEIEFSLTFWEMVASSAASLLSDSSEESGEDWRQFLSSRRAERELRLNRLIDRAEEVADRRAALVKGLRISKAVTSGKNVEYFLLNYSPAEVVAATGEQPPGGYTPNAILDQAHEGISLKPRKAITVGTDLVGAVVCVEPVNRHVRESLSMILAERDIALVADTDMIADTDVVDQTLPDRVSRLIDSDSEDELRAMQYTFAFDGGRPLVSNAGREIALSAALIATSVVASRVACGQAGMLSDTSNAIDCDRISNPSFRNAGDVTSQLPINTLQPVARAIGKEVYVFSDERAMHGTMSLTFQLALTKVLTEIVVRLNRERPKIKSLKAAIAKAKWFNEKFIPKAAGGLFAELKIDLEGISRQEDGVYSFPVQATEHDFPMLCVLKI